MGRLPDGLWDLPRSPSFAEGALNGTPIRDRSPTEPSATDASPPFHFKCSSRSLPSFS